MAIYGPAPGLKGRTFELWVLNKWVFNFCGGETTASEQERERERERERKVGWAQLAYKFCMDSGTFLVSILKKGVRVENVIS